MATLTGTVDKVYDQRKGTSDSGKRWSVQRFKLSTEDGEQVTCEAWGMRDLESLDGSAVTVSGKMVTEKYEGQSYTKFKLDGPPKMSQMAEGPGTNEKQQKKSWKGAEEQDSWRVHLMKAANLLFKCHQAALALGLEEGEDARTLFIESKRYIAQMPVKPFGEKEPEPEPEPNGTEDPADEYGELPENEEEPF
jgi:hypothetical protein